MGLWLLQESLRTWAERGEPVVLEAVLRAAAEEPAMRSTFDVGDPRLLPPGDVPARVRDLCREAGVPVPAAPPALVRAVVDSLALAHRDAVHDLERLTGVPVDRVDVVGGGSRNSLLCRQTAELCGVPVVAGPVEATALGNVLVQARALGVDLGDLAGIRALVGRTHAPLTYEPGVPASTRRAGSSATEV
jgi:rhamnulokinase